MTTESNNTEHFFSLSTMPNDVKKVLELFPVDRLNWKPNSWEGNPGENFSAIEQICHLRDIETDGYHHRIQSMLRENAPNLSSIDGYELAVQRDYKNSSLAEVISEFYLAREKTIIMINNIESNHWDKIGFFQGYDNITLKSLIHFLCSHDFEHLASLRWLLGKIEGDKIPFNTL